VVQYSTLLCFVVVDVLIQLQAESGRDGPRAISGEIQWITGVGDQLSVPVQYVDRVCELPFGDANRRALGAAREGGANVSQMVGATTRDQNVDGEAKFGMMADIASVHMGHVVRDRIAYELN
jgi:hypothetical protein